MYRHTLRIMDDSSLSKVWLLVVCAVGLCPASTCALAAGDAGKGRSLYPVCTACHGAKGEGNAAMKAPKLAGQTGWYLKRQMELFQQGARGTAAGSPSALELAARLEEEGRRRRAARARLIAERGERQRQAARALRRREGRKEKRGRRRREQEAVVGRRRPWAISSLHGKHMNLESWQSKP